MGMILSLAIAFVITPWLALKLMKPSKGHEENALEHAEAVIAHAESATVKWLKPKFTKLFRPFLQEEHGTRNRFLLAMLVFVLIAFSVALPVIGSVVLKMLPFDNKSEFQVVLEMPSDTRVEKTAQVLREMSLY